MSLCALLSWAQDVYDPCLVRKIHTSINTWHILPQVGIYIYIRSKVVNIPNSTPFVWNWRYLIYELRCSYATKSIFHTRGQPFYKTTSVQTTDNSSSARRTKTILGMFSTCIYIYRLVSLYKTHY